MFLSTLVTLVIVPIYYINFDRFAVDVRKLARRETVEKHRRTTQFTLQLTPLDSFARFMRWLGLFRVPRLDPRAPPVMDHRVGPADRIARTRIME